MIRTKHILSISAIAISALMGISTPASADTILIQPLFEYPVAPDSIQGLKEKSNYLMDAFWSPFDFKGKSTVDQNALNHALEVYLTPMRFADEAKSNASMDALLQKLAKNPTLLLQFTKAAEENLYGPRASVWNDQLYLRFLDALIANKGIKKERKERYRYQAELLRNSLVGTTPKDFEYTTPQGSKAHFYPNGVITVIEFGNPDCDECRQAKLKLDTNVGFNTLVDKGAVNVLFINPSPEEGWEKEFEGYPDKWHFGANEDITDLYDIRTTPCLYVIDDKGKIAAKNITDAEAAMAIAKAVAESIQ